MSLQRRLTYLLLAFAGFALASSFGTIYGIQLYVENAVADFQNSLDESRWVERLRLDAREQSMRLHEIVGGLRQPDAAYLVQLDAFFSNLLNAAPYMPGAEATENMADLAAALKEEFDRCLAHIRAGDRAAAAELLSARIQNDLLPALDTRLQSVASILDASRNRSVDSLVATNTQVLVLSLVIGVSGAGLVAIGAALVRRWVILPTRALREAARKFAKGHLDFRVHLDSEDELGALGASMNRMAGSLRDAQDELLASEAKYRSLFENLRDAAILCEASGVVVECHNNDTNLLGAAAEHAAGRHFLEAWPEWKAANVDWAALLHEAHAAVNRMRTAEAVLPRGGGDSVIVDILAYPVEFGSRHCVAVVLRDMTERRRLERQARRAESMEASVSVARGVAHDFNNLLTSAMGSLSLLQQEELSAPTGERVQRAMRACAQAARLSRRLLEFAGRDRGRPQVLCLCETVQLILDALDEGFLEGIDLQTKMNAVVPVLIDRDQLTQIILNLIRNAREAMPDGGTLKIEVAVPPEDRTNRAREASRRAVLTISDTGGGMTANVKDRLFEPFFTTKSQSSGASRGLGLAIVYAAVTHAGGAIGVDSSLGRGTTFRVELPLADEHARPEPALAPGAAVEYGDSEIKP